MAKNDRFQEIVEATVTVSQLGGRGVLVPGNIILTAAHCVKYDLSGPMVLGDFYIEEIKTLGQEKIKLSPLAIEPLCDIAALSSIDIPELFDESIRFDRFCEKTKPVPLCSSIYHPQDNFRVYVYNHNGIWVPGIAEYCPPMIFVEAGKPIEGGASGGPIINEAGELVSVVSNFSIVDGPQKSNGISAFVNLALPVWINERIHEK